MMILISFWRWVPVPASILMASIAAVMLAFPLNQTVHFCLESTGHYVSARDFVAFVAPFDGALAAALIVLAGAFAAPAYRIRVAFVLLVLGGTLAWFCINTFYFPELRDQEFVRFWWTILSTWFAGLAAVAVVWLVSCK